MRDNVMDTTLEARALTTIGGTLELESADDDGANAGIDQWVYDFDLDAVTTVGNVVVHSLVRDESGIIGLEGLAHLPGDVTMEWTWELRGGFILRNLARIGGNSTVRPRQQVHKLRRIPTLIAFYCWPHRPTGSANQQS